MGSRDGTVVEHLPPTQTSHQCGPGSIQMWVEFVVGSRPFSERFFSGYTGFPLSSKTNISKFQFDLDYCHCQALYHEPLAREIAQALPVLLPINKSHLHLHKEIKRFESLHGGQFTFSYQL